MKITRTTAVFLCITMLFALFTGGVYAEDGVTYIDETTLVIEDGKVVSGDKSLIENGIVVIGDNASSGADCDDPSEEDTFGNEDPSVKIDTQTSGAEIVPDSSLPATETVTTEQTESQSSKQPVKDNSALTAPTVKPDTNTNTNTETKLPTETPTAVNPNVPQEGAKGSCYINYPSLGATLEGTTIYLYEADQEYVYVYQTQKVQKSSGTISSLTYQTSNTIAVFYRLKDAHSSRGPDGTGTFSGIMFDVIEGKTFNLVGSSTYDIRIDGRLCSSQATGASSFLPSSPTAVSRTNPQVSVPLMRVSGSNAKLNLTYVTLRNSNATGNGGGVRVGDGGTLKMTNCTIDNCDTTGNGGGIYIASGGSVDLNNVTIKNCNAAYGGAIYIAGDCTLKMNTVTIESNTAENSGKTDGNGGGMWIGASDTGLTIGSTVTFDNNTANNNGGAIALARKRKLTINGAEFKNNDAKKGGAISVYSADDAGDPTLILDLGKIHDNTASEAGGGVYIAAGTGHQLNNTSSTVNNSSIYNNSAPKGGGICVVKTSFTGVSNGKITLNKGKIYGNNKSRTDTNYGGGVYVDNGGTVDLKGTIIGADSTTNGNKAAHGAGVYVASGGTFTMNSGEIKYNTATVNGGGIYSLGQTNLNIKGGTISYNEATQNGGGIYVAGTNAGGVRIVGESGDISIHHNKSKDSGTGGGGGLCFSNHSSEEGVEYPVTGVVIGGGSNAVNIYSNEAIYGGGVRTLNSGYGLISVEIKNNVNIYSNTATAGETSTYKGGGGIFVGGNSELVIDGADIYNNIASFYGAGMVIAGGEVTFKSGNIRNHTVIHSGGGIEMMSRGSFTMTGGDIKENSANDGGGIHFDGTFTVTLSGGNIMNNTASQRGGGVAQGSGELTVSGTTIKDNTAHNGGGVYTNGGSLTVSGGFITSNDATYGGGVHIDDNTDKTKTVVFSGGTINENTAVYNGGGVWIGVFARFTMRNVTVDENYAGRIGGGLFFNRGNEEGTLLIESGTVSNNYTATPASNPNNTQYLGGGIYFGNGADGTLPCHAVLGGGSTPLNIFGNRSLRGGGICVDDGGGQPTTVVLNSGVNIYDNTALDTMESGMGGGGLYISPSGHVTMNEGATIGGTSLENGNKAKYGAGVQINRGTFIQNGGSIQYNTATYYAGGVYVIDTTFVMNGGTNKGNYAQEIGGGVYVSTGSTFELKTGAMLTENKANYGGGVYVNGTMTMSGGSIGNVTTDSNIATYGGGVCVAESGVFNMSGGSIKNNVYTEGAAFNMNYGGGVSVFGTFNMSGGEITGNQVTGLGGGVIIDEHNDSNTPTASFVMTGGSITNNGNLATTDAGNGGGIWVGTCLTFKIEGNGTNNPVISGNTTSATKANANGAGMFINRSVTNPIIIKNCTISDNICNGNQSKGGGICFSNTGLVSDNTATIENVVFDGNEAAIGGGISINGNSGYSYGITVTMDGLTVNDNEATNGEGGGIHVSGNIAKVSLSDSAVTNNTANGCGGGIYLFEAKGISGDAVSFSNVEVNGNTATGTDSFGGGLVVDTVVVNLTGNNEINQNTANAWGGGLIVRASGGTGVAEVNINMTDAGTTTINNNTVGKYGGGVHVANVGTSRFNMRGGEICGNTSNNASGGGIDTQGITTLNGTTISDNTAKNGGNIAFGGGVVTRGEISNLTLTNCTVSGNTAQYGGGVTVTEFAQATINGGTVSGNTADEAGGILVYNNSSATASGLTVSGNTTTAGDGGGVLVTINSSLEMENSFIYGNSASGSYEGETAYVAENSLVGAGGGVAVFDSSSFTLTSGGIYNNLASTAGDDVFANGSDTKLDLPSASDMDTAHLVKENSDDVYCWVEDYMNGDTSYTSGLNGSNGRIVMRYRQTPASVSAFTSNLEGTSPVGKYINDEDRFVAITFGVPKYNVGSVAITAPHSDDPNQRFVFTLSGVNTLGESINITVSALSDQTIVITELISGTYTIVQNDDWSWRYEFTNARVDDSTDSGTNSVTVTITGTELEEIHTVEYTNSLTNNKWLSHNSVGKVNIPPDTVRDDPALAASTFLIPNKRFYTV